MDDLERAARPYVIRQNGNVDTGGRKIIKAGTSEENFGGWWKTLPYAQQIKSIGPIRTKLVNDGKIAFGDLVDKKTGKVLTLADMGFTESGKPLPVKIASGVKAGVGAAIAAGATSSAAQVFTPVVQPVQTDQELADQIKQHVPPFTNVVYGSKTYMSTNGNDRVTIGTATYNGVNPLNPAHSTPMEARRDLMSAWNKLAT